jgi:cell division protein FtsX
MNKRNLWVLGFIGLFLIITACVNFINLATAQALKRAKEIGVRKVVGGVRAQIFWQFISETGLIASFAACIAIGLSILTLPVMNNWFKSQVELDFITDWKLSSFLLLLVMIVTFFAGSYPGLILAGFKPILAIKGKISQQSIGGFNTRRALIITQFAISQVLLIGMIVIASQMRYAKQSDLGFNKDAVVMIPVGPEAKIASMNTVKDQLSKVPGVENVSLCFSPPSSDQSWRNTFRYDKQVRRRNLST